MMDGGGGEAATTSKQLARSSTFHTLLSGEGFVFFFLTEKKTVPGLKWHPVDTNWAPSNNAHAARLLFPSSYASRLIERGHLAVEKGGHHGSPFAGDVIRVAVAGAAAGSGSAKVVAGSCRVDTRDATGLLG